VPKGTTYATQEGVGEANGAEILGLHEAELTTIDRVQLGAGSRIIVRRTGERQKQPTELWGHPAFGNIEGGYLTGWLAEN
jgi:hypothetical protein